MKSKLVENFQFPLLGIFPCISCLCRIYGLVDVRLSIPLTWDFSLHLSVPVFNEADRFTFQFPLLGIFPCIFKRSVRLSGQLISFNSPYLGFFLASSRFGGFVLTWTVLSIPLTWDFSLHPKFERLYVTCEQNLSIPLTWDFSLHLQSCRFTAPLRFVHFQFPLLGIFPCIMCSKCSFVPRSLCLSIPLTWDFSLHPGLPYPLGLSDSELSIPLTWDFSLHLAWMK